MTLTNLTKVKSVPKLVNAISAAIQSEDDGFGYSIQTALGTFGERTLDPRNFRYSMGKTVLDFPFLKQSYNRFGRVAKPNGAGIFHGRTSTNDATLINTHPIHKHGWELIHNGVVSDHGPKYEMITSNDTEHLIERLATGGIDAATKHLTGYYAVAAFDPKGQLHTLRDDRAPLYFAEIKTIDSYVLATTKESIMEVCREMEWKYSVIEMLADNYYLVWRGNELISQTTFTPRGSTVYENTFASASLREDRETWKPIVSDYSGTNYATDDYTKDEREFLKECELMDENYTILDWRENYVSLVDFQELDADEKLCCLLIRPDGTVADPADYNWDTIFAGRIA